MTAFTLTVFALAPNALQSSSLTLSSFTGTSTSFAARTAAGSVATVALRNGTPPKTAATMMMMSSMALFRGAGTLADYSRMGVWWFTSIRVPAALIAGSSLSALFQLADETKDDKIRSRSKIEARLLVLYHVLSLVSFLLSMNVIITATATSNNLLLGFNNPMAESAYALLKREYENEFDMVRWSFYVALLSFLGCIATRLLLEFDLLVKRRVRSVVFVVCSVSALFWHLVAFINAHLNCWPNLASMTLHVITVYFRSAVASPANFISMVSCLGAVGAGISLFARAKQFATTGQTQHVLGSETQTSEGSVSVSTTPATSAAVTNMALNQQCSGSGEDEGTTSADPTTTGTAPLGTPNGEACADATAQADGNQ